MKPNRLKETVAQNRERARRGTRMVCILSMVVLLIAAPVAAQTTDFNEFYGWEDGTFQGWTPVSQNGDPDVVMDTKGQPGEWSLYIPAEGEGTTTGLDAGSYARSPESVTGELHIKTRSYSNLQFDSGGVPNEILQGINRVYFWGGDYQIGWGDYNPNTGENWEFRIPGNSVATVDQKTKKLVMEASIVPNGDGSYDITATLTSQDGTIDVTLTSTIDPSTTSGKSDIGEIYIFTQQNYDGTSGSDPTYDTYWDSIQYSSSEITGTPTPTPPTATPIPEEERLSLDVRTLLKPNMTYPFDLFYWPSIEGGERGERQEVTTDDNTTYQIEDVTVNGTQALTLNATRDQFDTVANESVAVTVNVTASYASGTETLNTTKTLVVADASVENLAILPGGLSRGEAVITDDFIFALLIAAFLSVPASRFANAFAGLGVAEMVIVVGWLGGYVPLGIAMLSIFMAMFVGLNLAANIDYTMRR